MTPRRSLAALALTSLLVLPTLASSAIVEKWRTISQTYRLISDVLDLNGDGINEIITGEAAGGAERIALRSSATGALVAQTAGTYQTEEVWIVNVDADDDAEIVLFDGVNLTCLQYTVGMPPTLAVRWTYLIEHVGGATADWEFVDFDGNGQLHVAYEDDDVDLPNPKYYVRNNVGTLVATLNLTTAPSEGQWEHSLQAGHYDSDDAEELLIRFTFTGSPASDVLYVFENNAVSASADLGGGETRVYAKPKKLEPREGLERQAPSTLVPRRVGDTQAGW